MQDQTETVILRIPAVRKMTGLPTSTIYHMMAKGKFPANIKLGYRAVGWLQSDIISWIDSKIIKQV
ncbi:MAG: AlpA family transcriptional regulator [Micavibrio sp.]|nr:AlpA family transcriptional regulator [Micavibrio sp.]MBK9561894.1 AlpA family transcriptional regulator [Micavibrio sp.]